MPTHPWRPRLSNGGRDLQIMERHKPIPQPFFPSYNRTPKNLGCLNTLHPNPRDEFKTFWRHVKEFLVAGELWIDHKKDIFLPRSSAATCTNRPLEVDQRLSGSGRKLRGLGILAQNSLWEVH
ncbi:hypothetical protein Taro_053605 [Colocasia esculenta]|uniref:Uncharacterized protein n=1 Tax=Colocasia esculenta TaxID=4460 RepID=A0A843XN34_COLES|nr:hypothetical protein [Colocasia esculenta]